MAFAATLRTYFFRAPIVLSMVAFYCLAGSADPGALNIPPLPTDTAWHSELNPTVGTNPEENAKRALNAATAINAEWILKFEREESKSQVWEMGKQLLATVSTPAEAAALLEKITEGPNRSILKLETDARFNWGASELISQSDKKDRSPEAVAAQQELEWRRTNDPRLAFLLAHFPLSLKSGVLFKEMILRNNAWAGFALAELAGSIDPSQKAKLQEDLNKSDKDLFLNRIRMALAPSTQDPSFKEYFEPWYTDKINANREYATRLQQIATAPNAEKRNELRDSLVPVYGKSLLDFAAFNLRNGNPALAATSVIAVAHQNSDGSVVLNLEPAGGEFNGEHPLQSILLGKSDDPNLFASAEGVAKHFNDLNVAGETSIAPDGPRLSRFVVRPDPISGDPAGSRHWYLAKGGSRLETYTGPPPLASVASADSNFTEMPINRVVESAPIQRPRVRNSTPPPGGRNSRPAPPATSNPPLINRVPGGENSAPPEISRDSEPAPVAGQMPTSFKINDFGIRARDQGATSRCLQFASTLLAKFFIKKKSGTNVRLDEYEGISRAQGSSGNFNEFSDQVLIWKDQLASNGVTDLKRTKIFARGGGNPWANGKMTVPELDKMKWYMYYYHAPILFVYKPAEVGWWHATACFGYDETKKVLLCRDSAFGNKLADGTHETYELPYDLALRSGKFATAYYLSADAERAKLALNSSGRNGTAVDPTRDIASSGQVLR
jgi:hypothetical protein